MIVAHSDIVGIEAAESGTTFKMAAAGSAFVPSLVTKAPIGRTFVYDPLTATVMSTVTVQAPKKIEGPHHPPSRTRRIKLER